MDCCRRTPHAVAGIPPTWTVPWMGRISAPCACSVFESFGIQESFVYCPYIVWPLQSVHPGASLRPRPRPQPGWEKTARERWYSGVILLLPVYRLAVAVGASRRVIASAPTAPARVVSMMPKTGHVCPANQALFY